jgi:hypothetical protein
VKSERAVPVEAFAPPAAVLAASSTGGRAATGSAAGVGRVVEAAAASGGFGGGSMGADPGTVDAALPVERRMPPYSPDIVANGKEDCDNCDMPPTSNHDHVYLYSVR